MQKVLRKTLSGCVMAGVLALAVLPNAVVQAQDGSVSPSHDSPAPRTVFAKLTSTATSSIAINDTFDYVIAVTNSGVTSATAAVSDTLPPQTQIVGSPVLTVITPTVAPESAVFNPALGPQGTVGWQGTLSPGAKFELRITVKFLACPSTRRDDLAANAADGQSDTTSDDWDHGIVNAAILRVGNSLSVASNAFVPTVCRDNRPSPNPTPAPATGVDVAVRKYARLHPNWDKPERGWEASWVVLYGNRGSETANNVVLTDTPSGNQTPELVRSVPTLTPTQQGGSLVFSIGALPSLKGGGILFRTPLSFTTAAGTVLANSVSISATNDVSVTNNTDAVSVTVPYLPPVITYPVNGATCTGTLTIAGRAQAGSVVGVFVDDADVISATADANGDWSTSVFLEDGVHIVRAATAAPNNQWRRSEPVVLKVNSDLLWDPISLSFTGPDGITRHPKHWNRWFDDAGWYVTLAPSTTYTSSVRVCCTDPATVSMTVPGTGVVTFSDPDGDKIFTASFTTGDKRSMVTGQAKLCVNSAGETQCGTGRIVPIISSNRRHVVVLTRDGFYPPNLHVGRGDAVEIINMDETSRSFGTSPNMSDVAANAVNGGNVADAGGDTLYLDMGESYVLEADGATTFYDAQNANQKVVIDLGNGVYLPIMRR